MPKAIDIAEALKLAREHDDPVVGKMAEELIMALVGAVDTLLSWECRKRVQEDYRGVVVRQQELIKKLARDKKALVQENAQLKARILQLEEAGSGPTT